MDEIPKEQVFPVFDQRGQIYIYSFWLEFQRGNRHQSARFGRYLRQIHCRRVVHLAHYFGRSHHLRRVVHFGRIHNRQTGGHMQMSFLR